MVSVALFAADEDGVLVRLGLREAGVAATGAYVMEVQSGALDLRQFLGGASPDVVIYDCLEATGPETRHLDALRDACAALGIPCVLTVGDVRDLNDLVVSWAACILIRPYDADMAQLAIREALATSIGDDGDDDERGEAAA